MKKHFTTLIFALIGIGSIAQTYKVNYERKPNIEYQLRNETRPDVRARVTSYLSNDKANFLLIHSNENSHYFKKTKSMLDLYDGKQKRNISGTYKNFRDSTLLKQSLMHEKLYLIDDKLPKIEWSETGEAKTILGFKCKKITAEYNDKDLIAWYTSEIPIYDGPDMYWTNKGLILELYTQSLLITATDIEKHHSTTSIVKPDKGERVTLEEYRKALANLKISLMSTNK